MMLLVAQALPTIMRHRAAGYPVGRLFSPRHLDRVPDTNAALPGAWAADNDAFSGFNAVRYEAMLLKLLEAPSGCLFVAVPDVVADHAATLASWARWRPVLLELPAAFVAQDGCTPGAVPWDETDALFIGGSTAWKLGSAAAALIGAARDRGRWVHMGRVNSVRRLRYAKALGCDSVDGSTWSWFSARYLPAVPHVLAQEPLW